MSDASNTSPAEPCDSGLILRQATTLEDLEEVRKIRNSCRFFMTRDQAHITREQQRQWTPPTNWRVFLLALDDESIGYGLIRHQEDGDWLSGGLYPGFRGKGMGRELFTGLIARCGRPMLEVLEMNLPALSLYLSLGFEVMERKDGVITMKMRFHDGVLL